MAVPPAESGSPRANATDSAAAEEARRRAEEAKRRAEEAKRRAEEAKRRAEQAARELEQARASDRPETISAKERKLYRAEKDANAATREYNRLSGASEPLPYPSAARRDSFGEEDTETTASGRRQLGLEGGAAPGSTLLTEDAHDGQRNCLDVAADWVELATPQLRARSELVFLADDRPGAEGQTGHVLIRQGERVLDPATQRSWENLEAYQKENPQYREVGTLPATAAAKVFATEPGSPERAQALQDAKVPPQLQTLLVADATNREQREGGEKTQAEQMAGFNADKATADAKWKELPPDTQDFEVDPRHPGLGKRSVEEGKKVLGPGDPKALEEYYGPAQPGLEQADVVVSGYYADGASPGPAVPNPSASGSQPTTGESAPKLGGPTEQAYRDRIAELQKQYPGAKIELVAGQMLPTTPAPGEGAPPLLAIRVTEPNQQVHTFTLSKDAKHELQETELSPSRNLVSVDVTELSQGKKPDKVKARVDISAAPTGKTYRFVDQGDNVKQLYAPTYDLYAMRGDHPPAVPLDGSYIENEVGLANQYPPTNEGATGPDSPLYTGKEAEELIKPSAEKIRELAKRNGQTDVSITALPVIYNNPKDGPVRVMVYRVNGPDGKELGYVDAKGREYKDWDAWKKENQLPPGRMTYPKNGHLSPNGDTPLETSNTPDTVDSTPEKIKQVADYAELAGAVVLTGAVIAGTGGTAVIVAGAIIGGYEAYKQGSALKDRADHGQTLSLTDPEARAEWIGLTAAVLTAGAGGAQLAGWTRVAAFANGGALAAAGTGAADLGIQAGQNWDQMSAGQKHAFLMQMAFFGITAGAAVKGGPKKNPYEQNAEAEAALPGTRTYVPGAAARPQLEGTPGFTQLSPQEQAQVKALMDAPDSPLANGARAHFDAVTKDPAYATATPEQQAALLRRSLTEEPWLPALATQGAAPQEPVPYELQRPSRRTMEFQGEQMTGQDYTMVVDGRVLVIRVPEGANGLTTAEQVAEGIARMPKAMRDRVKEVTIEPKPNVHDAEWKKQYGPDHESYMTCGADGVVHIYPTQPPQSQATLNASLIHESGHAMSHNEWGPETSDPRWNRWRQASQSDPSSASAYAKKSLDEDFAETLTLYSQVVGTPQEAAVRALMPERFKILDELTKGTGA